jgi:hypothetical protein
MNSDSEPTAAPSSGFADFVLCRIRVAHARARLIVNDIEAIGVALKGGVISPEVALLSLDQAGALALFPSSSEAA